MVIESPIDVEGVQMPSRSTLRVLREQPHPQWGAISHVRLSPHTGRTHQLRIHAASVGVPIVGDDLYWELATEARERRGMAPLPAIRKSGGLFLQSCAVEFNHPAAEGGVMVEAEAEAEGGGGGAEGRIRVEVDAEPRFAALLERARKGAEFESGVAAASAD